MHDPPPEWPEPDIYDYGVERLLIVQRDLVVDWLVLNNVHAEQRTLIVSENGYPDYLLQHARKALADNPELPVFLLHDSEPGSPPMEARVRSTDLLPIEGHPVVDLGLFPDDVRHIKKLDSVYPDYDKTRVPVDALAMGTLSIGLADAMTDGVALGDLLERVQRGDTTSDSSFG